MRAAPEIILSKTEPRKLEQLTSARSTPVRLGERARIVLMAARGMTNNQNPRPLVWTKTVDGILEKVHRGRGPD